MRCLPFAVAGAMLAPALASAQLKPDPRWEFGLRSGVLIGSGKPANDLLFNGIKAIYRLDAESGVGLSIDRLSFDFERPQSVLGIEQDKSLVPKDIDAKAKATLISVFYERRYATAGSPWSWNWNAGLGFASPSVRRASGPAAGGGSFDVGTDAGREYVPSVGLGAKYSLSNGLHFEAGLNLNRHIANWKVTDAVSGRSGRVRDYTTTGLSLGLGYRF